MQQTTHNDDILSPDFSSPLEYFTSNHFDQSSPPLDPDDPWKTAFKEDISNKSKLHHPFTDSSSSSHETSPDSESQQQHDTLIDVITEGYDKQAEPLHYDLFTAGNVLSGIEVPKQYSDLFNAIQKAQARCTDITTLEFLLKHTRLKEDIRRQIMISLDTPGKSGQIVTRDEFDVYLALIGCAQNNMDVSLDTVYQNRYNLPIPDFDINLDDIAINDQYHPLALNHCMDQEDSEASKAHIISRSTTSATIKALSGEDVKNTETIVKEEERQEQSLRTMEYNEEQEAMNTWILNADYITVSRAPVKEGFLLKHINYEVESEKYGTKVLRRYSDFWWLWETLLKRYPFRIIPNLPPKRVGGRTDVFEEQRRKGLKRFINAVVSHPILGRDDVVKAFLTHPSEMNHWKRINTPSMDEEFVRIPHDIARYERLIPVDMIDRINQSKKRLPASIQQYHKLCLSMEQILRSKKALGIGYTHYSVSLNSIKNLEKECWLADCKACPKVAKGYDNVARSMQQAGSILIRQAAATGETLLEGLRRHRDALESFKDLLERLDKSNVAVNDAVLSSQMAKHKKGEVQPDTAHDEPYYYKNYNSGCSTHMALITQRGIFINYCLIMELSYIHKQQANVSVMYNDFVKSELKNAKQWSEHWRSLEPYIEDMPNAPQNFI